MEVKDTLLENMDNILVSIMYSLDLSAAFDMLRKDTFVDNMRSHMPPALLNIIADFLSNRRFYVNVGDLKSEMFMLDRGCPQGSVLGTVLFNLYIGKIHEMLPPEVCFVAYADDSYVICPGKNLDEAKALAESSLRNHIQSLRDLGMVVNGDKT